jgi:hypothetical protein
MNTIQTFFKNMGKGPAMVISLLAGLSLGLLIGGCVAHGGHRGYREYGEMRYQGNNQGYGYQNQNGWGNGMMNTMWGMRNMMNNQNPQMQQNIMQFLQLLKSRQGL